jgi:hypothetical protein
MFIEKVLKIPTNKLLRGTEKELLLQNLLHLIKGVKLANSLDHTDVHVSDTNLGKNLLSVPEDKIEQIYNIYGTPGLFKLFFLAQVEDHRHFSHFCSLLIDNLIFMSIAEIEKYPTIKFDNDLLLESQEIGNFNHNVILPELSRKFFNPGTRPGYLVYGLGGPKILVSHPFRGLNGEIYNVYQNSLDVVTSLNIRGFYGSFLFLDYIAGLNYELNGIKAWLAWFSLISVHSDLVIFIKQNADFSPSQKEEIAYTPNRVKKKIIHIPPDELQWAKTPSTGNIDINFDEKGNVISLNDFYRRQTEHTRPLLEAYVDAGFPRDRIIQIDEESRITEYALDYSIYD